MRPAGRAAQVSGRSTPTNRSRTSILRSGLENSTVHRVLPGGALSNLAPGRRRSSIRVEPVASRVVLR